MASTDDLMAQVKASPTSSALPVRRPTPAALDAAEHLAARAKGRSAQVRRIFVERLDNTPTPPPLARLLRGGRGGQVRLKLLLAMLWVGAAPPHDVTYPARAYAALLGLREPETAGARRILDAIAWLEKSHLVTVESRPGHPSRVTLLQEDGSGLPYTVPGAEITRMRGKQVDDAVAAQHRYIQIPSTFWTNGWMAVLSGPGLAMLLVLFTELGGRDPSRELWFSPGMAKRRFDLSEDTRIVGIRELADAQLVTVARRDTNPDPFAVRRLRNVYRLHTERLAEHAVIAPRQSLEPQAV